MTTSTRIPPAEVRRIPLTRMVAAEVYKLRSIRSYRWTVALAAAAVVVAAGVMSAVVDGGGGAFEPDPIALPLEYFAYAMMIIGVLAVTTDIASGTAAITDSLVPWRSRVVFGKYLASGGLAVLAAVAVGVLVLLAAWLGSGTDAATMVSSDALSITAAGVATICLATVLGVAFGILVRSTAAAVSLLLLWSFLIETVLIFVIPEQWAAFLPFKTIGGSRLLMGELSAGAGLAVFALYTAVLVTVASVCQIRRDSAVV